MRTLLEELRELLISGDNPGLRRLYPTAYPQHEDLEEGYRSLVHDSLLAQRLDSIEAMENTLEATTLTDEQLEAWMHSVNSVRLVLGTILDVGEGDELPDDPTRPTRSNACSITSSGICSNRSSTSCSARCRSRDSTTTRSRRRVQRAPRWVDHRGHRAQDDPHVARQRPVVGVIEVEVLVRLERRVRSSADLPQSGETGPHQQAGDADRVSTPRLRSGSAGRGPTRLMSPRTTFHSCGSSSSEVLRNNRPTRRDAGIVAQLEQRPAASLRDASSALSSSALRHHRAQLDDREQLAVSTDAVLTEEHGTA